METISFKEYKMDYSDKEIIEGIKANKKTDHYLLHLYKQNFRSIVNYVKVNSGTQQDAEDIIQEALMIFIHSVHQDKFRQEASIKTFLYSICRNLWLQHLKKAAKVPVRDLSPAVAVQEVKLQDIVREEASQKIVLQIFEQLGEECKKLLTLFYIDRLNYDEIFKLKPFRDYKNQHVLRTNKYNCWKKFKFHFYEYYKNTRLSEEHDEQIQNPYDFD